MVVMEDNEHVGSGHVIHDTVVHLNGVGGLGRWHDHA